MPRWTPVVGFGLFILGYVGTLACVSGTDSADRLDGVVQFDMWVALLSALGGFALVAVMFCDRSRPTTCTGASPTAVGCGW